MKAAAIVNGTGNRFPFPPLVKVALTAACELAFV
jgi:hypothetical protein